MKEYLLQFARQIVFCLSLLFLGFLSIVSLISTAYFDQSSSFAETPQYRMDSFLMHFLFLGLFLGILFLLHRFYDWNKIPVKKLAAFAVLFVTGVSILWVEISHTYPEADQKAVSWVAYLLTQNNFLFFEPGKYMQIYPNQLGLAAILEFLYRLCGWENWKAFMYLTAAANGAVAYLLYKLTDVLFKEKKVTILVLFLSMGCVQILLYTTFLYGMMLGLSLSLGGFLCLLYALEKDKKGIGSILFGLLAGILTGASILVKNNYGIFLVAMVIFLFYKALEKWNWYPLVLAGILMLAGMGMSRGLTAFYEARSGMEMSSGMPKTLWIAMGMQEGERAEGWYNAFNYDTFLENNCDIEKSEILAKAAIEESIKNFRENPGYALRFYYKKTVSQWNEPTYEALWVNQFHSGEFSRIVQSIYDGKLYTVLHEYMNEYQSLIFIAVVLALLKRRKSWRMEELFLLVVILGGFFFHTLWEAKSQYIFPYFVILLPYAAVGIYEWLEMCDRRVQA